MKPSKKRRRCCVCRRWYIPHHSAQQTQKTCSTSCREERRRRLARERRARDVTAYRIDERERQQKCREARRSVAVGKEPGEELSRSGVLPQVTGLKELMLKIWDKLAQRSRARLRRQLGAELEVILRKLGQAGTRKPVGHEPASVANPAT
jgi:hypothetical protein